MTELIELPEVSEENYPAIFCTGGLKPFIDAALAEAELIKKELPDVSTNKGRKAIGSAAAKVSKSKAAIEKPGAEYTRKIKAEGVAIASELSAFKKTMDSIRDDVQAPLIAYKEAEKQKADLIEGKIQGIISKRELFNCLTGDSYTSAELLSIRREVEGMEIWPEHFSDRHDDALHEWGITFDMLDIGIRDAKKGEEMAAENERLKAETEELKIQARVKEEAAKEVAAEKLKAAQAVEKTLEDVRKQEANKAADAKAKKEAELRASEDVNHRKAVNNLALNELMQCCPELTNDQAMNIVKGLTSNKFTDLKINY